MDIKAEGQDDIPMDTQNPTLVRHDLDQMQARESGHDIKRGDHAVSAVAIFRDLLDLPVMVLT